MGEACERECLYGQQGNLDESVVPPKYIFQDNGVCQCWPCWEGASCSLQCSDQGTCVCQQGRKGPYCEYLDCPPYDTTPREISDDTDCGQDKDHGGGQCIAV